jgi:hypothetical protein
MMRKMLIYVCPGLLISVIGVIGLIGCWGTSTEVKNNTDALKVVLPPAVDTGVDDPEKVHAIDKSQTGKRAKVQSEKDNASDDQ